MSDPKDQQPLAAGGSTPPPKIAGTLPEPPLFDRRSTHQRIFYGLIAACAVVVVADFFYHKHGHFHFEEQVGFHAAFGFVAYLTIVNSAKLLRRFVKRSEDYYER